MPSASDASRQPSRSPATKTPLSSQTPASSEASHSRQTKKRGKNAGRTSGLSKTEAKEVHDTITGSLPTSPPESSSNHAPAAGPLPPSQMASPVLDALSSLGAIQDNDINRRTDSWAKSIPFGKTPPNDPTDKISASESPPVVAIPDRGGFAHTPPSPSLPAVGRPRPLSYGNGYLNFTPAIYQSGDRQQRRYTSTQFQNGPPPPHLPQPHFYGAPDIEIPGPTKQSARSLQQEHYSFCAFDALPSQSVKPIKLGSKVLLAGYDECLEVLALENSKYRVVGRLDGLGGRVLDAKILTWASKVDPLLPIRPLIAITIHGPIMDEQEENRSFKSDQVDLVPSDSNRPASEIRPKLDPVPHFQTRVEVYSLRTQERITTLFSTNPMPCLEGFPGLPVSAPPPIGRLRIYASGNYTIVASGVSGEVFIYTAKPRSPSGVFQCLGKTWARVQQKSSRRLSNSSSSTEASDSRGDSDRPSELLDRPILAVCGRWLAVVCPPSTATVSLQGVVPPHLIQKKSFGIESHTPPSRPSVTCSVDVGERESLFNKLARGVTQELYKGAQWVGDQGIRTWNNYWNKDAQQLQATQARRPYQLDPHAGYNLLPPTHAQETQAALASEPDLVSIIDMRKLEDYPGHRSSFLSPVATFQSPDGCRFLSFAPNGLMLLTTSTNGDIQHVWDLMQVKYCRAATLIPHSPVSGAPIFNGSSPHVRQVARYARYTTSDIVDVIWTGPMGEHLAIITKNGTAHVLNLPRSAFHWPPLRRAIPAVATKKDSSAIEDFEDNTGNRFSAAMKLVGGKTQPILAAMRGRAPSVGAPFSGAGAFGITTATGIRGGKVVAAGLSKSVGAATDTVNTLRHVGENRLHLRGFAHHPAFSRVAWFKSGTNPLLGTVDSGYFRLYKVRGSSVRNSKNGQSVVGAKVTELRLPPTLQTPSGPEQPVVVTGDGQVTGFWTISQSPRARPSTVTRPQPLSFAEIEANSPYQPFHTDRRVCIRLYPADYQEPTPLSDPWAFGEVIPTIKLNVSPVIHSDEEDEAINNGHNGPASSMENHITLGNVGEVVEHVVITTRRKKRSPAGPSGNALVSDEDGFFEDDCEVLDFARDRV
ncbi:hypothetical protein AJ80_02691 [Polytolypa hystricis UAMH7299]|uniref:Uncharacterized protein n=1 Tax=Polytolypa hystricis (strain UAMH7299) TaxID=1447883 RepID=A0A2B7YPP9_POLH7|nr:hypothetical protein AJ80_02691 [Polytolypa hystricis UAMH7299]